ncbi:MAG: response regulator transcription factor [Verrucomicrobia bacterium]|nr:response regulator transcription factor [Leptolyngbya sp. ES-bin-22]
MTKLRLVLIEDHDLTRLGLRMIFQQHAAVEIVGEAADGVTGLKLLETLQPDVAVVDVGLPGLDGIELTRRYKQRLSAATVAPILPTKVMILTMQESEDAVLAAFTAGADSYCMKGLSVEQLLEALQSTYAGNNWIDPAIAQIVLQQYRQTQAAVDARLHDAKTVDILADDTQAQVLQSAPLTPRELEILALLVIGYSNARIASACYITVGTVKTHVRNLLHKLCVDDRTQAAVRALRAGLVA